jgi:hypothetical protein
MSEDEIRTEIFKLWTKDGPVQMEYVTDSGKDRLRILYEDIGPSLEKEDKLVAVASEALAQINAGGDVPTITDRLHALYGDGAEYIEVMDLTMELKSAYDPRRPT